MQEQTETTPVETQAPEMTLEQQQGHMKEMAEFQHKAYKQLTKAHLSSLTRVLRSSNGVSQKEKILAEKALLAAINFALGYGVDADEKELPQKAQAYAKEAANIASSAIKAQDNRMTLVALQYEESAKATNEEVTQETETNTEVTNG